MQLTVLLFSMSPFGYCLSNEKILGVHTPKPPDQVDTTNAEVNFLNEN